MIQLNKLLGGTMGKQVLTDGCKRDVDECDVAMQDQLKLHSLMWLLHSPQHKSRLLAWFAS